MSMEQLKEILKDYNNYPLNVVEICTRLGIIVQQTEEFPDDVYCVTTVDNPRYKSIIEKKWTEEMWKAADVQVIGRVIKNMSYTI